jgi:thioredoxin 1
MLEFTKDNFDEEVLKSDLPVLVDYWNPSCKPCMALKPQIEGLAEKYSEKLKVGGINTMAGNMRFAISQSVMGLPAIHLFKSGTKVFEMAGEVDLVKLENEILKII